MSSSPLDPARVAEVNDARAPYHRSILAVDDLIERGNSLSGHERNVCFLNLAQGDARFATASAVTGIDIDDDARAAAPVDWDGDGDLDLWMANRTAPMLRFLKNTHTENRPAQAPADWLQVRLAATRGARDAIGARVTLELAGGASVIRVLKAGEGFLTQTTKWLHFGVGSDARIDRVLVRWPGRAEETFAGLKPGGRYTLTEGTGTAVLVPRPAKLPALATGAAPLPEIGAQRAVAGSRFPLPVLPWQTFDGEVRLAGGTAPGFTLINLWATWCAPCLKELKAFANDQKLLTNAGVGVLALSVDGLAGDQPAGDPASLARASKFPYPTGRATPLLVQRLERARRFGWGVQWPLPVPTSLLIDPTGRLVALYLGPVTPAQVVADVQRARTASDEAWHDSSFPFPGPWIERPSRPLHLPIALELMDEGAVDDTREFATRTRATLSRHKDYATLLGWIADNLMGRGEAAAALETFIAAVQADETNILILNNFAWHRATHPDPAFRDPAEAVRLGEKAATLTAHQDPRVLDTLAAAYASAGRFSDAVTTAEKALTLARHGGLQPVIDSLTKGLQSYRRGQPLGQ